ncbi:unnamed protein product [Pocillopora meandrina]|uniref:Uncharacterized protein n=1 Tax=Pocillopora meandrina TaxID=46732 RepID=A0AAU9X5H6_9CNID|nr:unnamed protein product [Pocillopora meandrina]
MFEKDGSNRNYDADVWAVGAINTPHFVNLLPRRFFIDKEQESMMFLRLAVLFCVVCLASSEKEKNSEDPPGLLQALNSKYFGHIRGKRTGKDDYPPLEQALNNAYFGHIRGKRTQSNDYPPLEEALNSAYFGHIRGKRTVIGYNPALREALNRQFFGRFRGKRTGGWGSNKDLLEALNNAYMGHIRGKRQQVLNCADFETSRKQWISQFNDHLLKPCHEIAIEDTASDH